jgi:hypothetical protein
MLVLKILGIVALIASVLAALYFFNEHCDKKFSYRFFTTPSFVASAVALVLLIAGNSWRVDALQSGGDVLNGVVVMGLGVLVALGLIYFNFRRTNFLYGTGGTVLQLLVFSVLAYIGIFVFIIAFVLGVIANIGVQRVHVVKK